MAESNIFTTEDFTTVARVVGLVMNTGHMPFSFKSPVREDVHEHRGPGPFHCNVLWLVMVIKNASTLTLDKYSPVQW